MAATLTAGNELTYASFPIEKFERDADGDLLVYGKATDGTVDTDDQIVDPAWSQKALADWIDSGGNVRVQHNPQRDPAGKGVAVEFTPDGHYVKALIVEPVAKRLVEKGVLRAYSVGISRPVIERDMTGKARGGLIKGGVLSELSLVDRPANGNCTLQLIKAAADGSAEYVGKMVGAGGTLTKAAAEDGPITGTVSFSPADMAKLLKLRHDLEKGTAGGNGKPASGDDDDDDDDGDDGDDGAADSGSSDSDDDDVKEDDAAEAAAEADEDKTAAPDLEKKDLSSKERDNLDDSSFAYIDSQGGRHLPIHDEGHVRSALGRFNQTQFEGGKAKKKAARKILARARGMGIDVAPDAAVAQAAKIAKGGKCPTCKGSGKILGGNRKCPDCGGDGTLEPGGPGEEETAKSAGGKKPYHRDPDETVQCPACQKYNAPDATFCDQCGAKLPAAAYKDDTPDVTKAGDKACKGCGKNYHADSPAKFCENCGGKLPAVGKAAKPTPADGVTGEDADPVPAHREPDGDQQTGQEQFEKDAGIPTVPDASVEVKTARQHAATGAPATEAVLHDLTCAAFSAKVLGEAYPWLGDVRDAVDVAYWRDQAISKAAGSPLEEAQAAADRWQHAETLKGAAPAELTRAHDELHKAFQDANPGPGTAPTPGDVRPGQFKRPYLAAGHGRPSPAATDRPGGGAGVPTDTPDAGDYHRGLITDGHQRPSPSDDAGSNAKVPPPAAAGTPGRVYYTRTSRDSARSAMASMHDHIAQTFPDLCPMSGKAAQPPPPAAAPVPDVTKTAAELPRKVKKTKTPDPAIIKAAVVDDTIPSPELTKQIGDLQNQLDKSRRDYEQLAARVEEMATAPDPRQAPFKGVMAGYPPARTPAAPASAIQKAADTAQGTLLTDLQTTWLSDPDPATRENAYRAIRHMLDLPGG